MPQVYELGGNDWQFGPLSRRPFDEVKLQAVSSIKTLQACLSETELWPPGDGWKFHNAQLDKLWRYARWALKPVASSDSAAQHKPAQGENKFRPVSQKEGARELAALYTLEEFATASQRVQALGLQVAIEHMRRRKYNTRGVCLWQFNEPWPAISWAIVDYWRRPKLAYQRLKDLYNPVLVGLTFRQARYQAGESMQAEVWAVNDSLARLEGCWLQIELDSVKTHEVGLTLPPDSVQTVGVLTGSFPGRAT